MNTTSKPWKASLKLNSRNQPDAHVRNVIAALRNAPEWSGVLAWNEFNLRIETLRPTPWGSVGVWSDEDEIHLSHWLYDEDIKVGPDIAFQAVRVVARDHRFHPVRTYLDALAWDQRPRLDSWMISILSAENNPYVRSVSAKWAISAVARIYDPGCQVDTCIVLEGSTGIFKSSALRVMASDAWFSDDWRGTVDSKDFSIAMRGIWIFELSEFDSIRGIEASRVKSFISRRVEHYRPPYGRHAISQPRQCVFAGTTNRDDYLHDETGGRRFWPIPCGRIDLTRLERDRDQLWAEARDRYRAAESWWFNTEEQALAGIEQDARYAAHVWQDRIAEWIANPKENPVVSATTESVFRSRRGEVTTRDVLLHCIGMALSDSQIKRAEMDVATCLRKLGWKSRKAGPETARYSVFRKPVDKAKIVDINC